MKKKFIFYSCFVISIFVLPTSLFSMEKNPKKSMSIEIPKKKTPWTLTEEQINNIFAGLNVEGLLEDNDERNTANTSPATTDDGGDENSGEDTDVGEITYKTGRRSPVLENWIKDLLKDENRKKRTRRDAYVDPYDLNLFIGNTD